MHRSKITIWTTWLVVFTGCVSSAWGEELPETITSFLEQNCIDCHDEDSEKGNFRVDVLEVPEGEEFVKKWGLVLNRLEAGEMPPPKRKRPPVNDLQKVNQWIKSELSKEVAKRRLDGRVRIRRLNRLEYENTIQDLLDIGTSLAERLPEDDLVDGFSNGTEALAISPVHIHQYLDAAEVALEAAIVRRKPAEKITHLFSYDNEKEKGFYGHGNNKPMIRPREGNLWFYSNTHIEVPAYLRQFGELTKTKPGRYKIKIRAWADDTDKKPLIYNLWTAAGGKRRALIGHFDAQPDKPTVTEIEHWFDSAQSIIVAPYRILKARNDYGLNQYTPQPDLPKDWKKSGKFYEPVGPALVVAPVEITGPIYESWPPPSYKALFGDVPLVPYKQLPSGTVTPRSITQKSYHDKEKKWHAALTAEFPEEPLVKAEELLLAFAPRAFRRPVESSEVLPYLDIVKSKLEQKLCFESSMLPAYKAMLCSPHFLFLVEAPGKLTDHALANRLSYFLWRSQPDEHLRKLADNGQLNHADTLRKETERLLKSPKSAAFVKDFLDHWLNLREIDATTPDRELYPEYFSSLSSGTLDPHLHESIQMEPRITFTELLKHNGSLLQLIHADHIYLNGRLAEHYGIEGPKGSKLKKFPVPAGSHRGGVLTQAAVLKVTANGANTSPVVRGNWVLERITGQPPPPPPPDAGSIEPDTRGATNIREQLDKHKSAESCAGCHRRIDPPGFAMEAFDPIGQLRTFYRATEVGEKVDEKVWAGGYRKVKYLKGTDVDASGETAEGTPFTNPTEFKKSLIQKPEFLARNLTAQLLTFGTGKHMELGDYLALEGIVEKTKANQYGLRDLLHEVIQSNLFRNK